MQDSGRVVLTKDSAAGQGTPPPPLVSLTKDPAADVVPATVRLRKEPSNVDTSRMDKPSSSPRKRRAPTTRTSAAKAAPRDVKRPAKKAAPATTQASKGTARSQPAAPTAKKAPRKTVVRSQAAQTPAKGGRTKAPAPKKRQTRPAASASGSAAARVKAGPPALAAGERAPAVAQEASAAAVAPSVPAMGHAPVGRQFTFDGGAATYIGTALLAFVVTVGTLFLCLPFAVVLLERWRAKHSYIDGHRLAFRGSGFGLFGLWIKWWLLCLVTLGVYGFWVMPRLARWKWENTAFEQPVGVGPAGPGT